MEGKYYINHVVSIIAFVFINYNIPYSEERRTLVQYFDEQQRARTKKIIIRCQKIEIIWQAARPTRADLESRKEPMYTYNSLPLL